MTSVTTLYKMLSNTYGTYAIWREKSCHFHRAKQKLWEEERPSLRFRLFLLINKFSWINLILLFPEIFQLWYHLVKALWPLGGILMLINHCWSVLTGMDTNRKYFVFIFIMRDAYWLHFKISEMTPLTFVISTTLLDSILKD